MTPGATPDVVARAAPGLTPRIQVRLARQADLPALRSWLPAGAAADLPPSGSRRETWLVALQRGEPQPRACLRLRRAIGLDLPRHWYHVGCVVHAAPELGLFHRLQTLQLGNDLTGASELADIAWQPGLDTTALTDALLPLLAGALDRLRRAPALAGATDLVVAELPGLLDAQGRSPFWQGLARPFYDGDPQQAALRFGPAWRSHAAVLMPRQPVYSAFLPADAQAAIGQAHPGCAVLDGLLRQAGLRPSGHITIDQGGPVLVAPLHALQAGSLAGGG